jgi:hypothetical protein
VAKYTLEIKPSAGKELDALDDALFARMDRKILVLAGNPRPPGCKKLRGYNLARNGWNRLVFPRKELSQGRRYVSLG